MLSDKEVTSFRVSDGNTIKLEYRTSLPSTIELAREYADAGYPDRYVIFTERETQQSAFSDGSHGLYLSCILRPSIFPSQAGVMGPLSAVSLASALEEHTSKKIGIGWVSDIFCDGIKLGCCSVEGKLDNFTSYEYLIVSFAVKLDEKNFPPRMADMLRKVFEADNTSVSMIIAKTVLNKFFATYRYIKTPERIMEEYKNKFALKNYRVKYIEDGKKRSGKIVEVDKKTFALIIEAKDGTTVKISSPSKVILPNKI